MNDLYKEILTTHIDLICSHMELHYPDYAIRSSRSSKCKFDIDSNHLMSTAYLASNKSVDQNLPKLMAHFCQTCKKAKLFTKTVNSLILIIDNNNDSSFFQKKIICLLVIIIIISLIIFQNYL
jgi:hypothetical protein